MACRMYVRSESGRCTFAEPATSDGQVIRYEKQNWLNSESQDFHCSVSAHPFELRLVPGRYSVTVGLGKEYLPWTQQLVVDGETRPLNIRLTPGSIWRRKLYSGDTHVHRPIRQIGVPMQADDVNVAMPMVYWTTRDRLSAADGDRTDRDDAARPAQLVTIDPTHVIWPKIPSGKSSRSTTSRTRWGLCLR